MKISIKKCNLLVGLNIPQSVSGKSDKSFSETLKFESQGNTIKVTGMCNGIEANLYCFAESIEDMTPFCVDAKRVASLVKAFKDESLITISKDSTGKKLIFKQGRSQHKLEFNDTVGFPESFEFKEGYSHIKVEYEHLRGALSGVAWAAAPKVERLTVDRLFLGSILLSLSQDSAKLFSADGLKCCRGEFLCEIVKSDTPDVLVPKRIHELLGLFAPYVNDGTIEFLFNFNQIKLIVPNVGVVTSSVCSQKYPDLTGHTNAQSVVECQVNSKELKEAIKRFSAGITESNKVGIAVEFDNNAMTMRDPKSGSVEVLDAELTLSGDSNNFNFQLKMLNEVSQHLNVDEVVTVGVNEKRWAHMSGKDNPFHTKAFFLEYKL